MLNKIVTSLPRSQEGATAVEYSLIAGLIAVVLITVMTLLGGGLESTFTTITDALTGN